VVAGKTAEIKVAEEVSAERRNIAELEAKISALENLLLATVAKVTSYLTF